MFLQPLFFVSNLVWFVHFCNFHTIPPPPSKDMVRDPLLVQLNHFPGPHCKVKSASFMRTQHCWTDNVRFACSIKSEHLRFTRKKLSVTCLCKKNILLLWKEMSFVIHQKVPEFSCSLFSANNCLITSYLQVDVFSILFKSLFHFSYILLFLIHPV